MDKIETTIERREAGFTLVELAVVMIIIGLLIGGVLKGQELIANAQISATVSQVKGVDAAVSTFRDSFAAFPGDMNQATVRLPNCAAPNCINGNGNNSLGLASNVLTSNTAENLAFWAHLSSADLVAGVKNTATAIFGEALPTAPVGGGLVVGNEPVGAIAGRTATAAGRSGHYVVIRSAANAAAGPANAVLSASQAARVDRKMDDGSPNGGTVLAIGSVGGTAANCASAATNVGVYNEALDGLSCSLAIRIQQ